jgi:hypothetical protein
MILRPVSPYAHIRHISQTTLLSNSTETTKYKY